LAKELDIIDRSGRQSETQERMMTEEIGWVIEAGWTSTAKPKYWCGIEGSGDGLLHEWRNDSYRAIRFSRKKDAEKIARQLIDPQAWRAAEHAWAVST
jgi:hypothetical protein